MPNQSDSTAEPRLRFPEFREAGPWERRKLSDLLCERKRRNRELKFGPEDVLSVSGDHGCVNQIALLGRSYAGVSVKGYHIVETGDLVYTKSPLKKNPYGIIKENKGRPGIVSTLYAVYHVTELGHPAYLDHYFSRDYNLNSYLQPIVRKGAKNDMKVNNAAVLSGEVLAPKTREQQKIAEFLTSLDEIVAVQGRKVEALRTYKRGLMQQLFPREGETIPRLRFPEFVDAAEWREYQVGDLIDALTPPKKLGTSLYGVSGAFPIVDQSPSPVCGWTDDAEALLKPEHPVVVFGDHTCTVKLMREPFAQGADGIKILSARPSVLGEFLFQALLVRPLVSTEYKRHFAELREKVIAVPLRDTGEQERVISVLSSLDAQIAANATKLGTLQTYKKGLMQQLFPSPEDY